MTAREIIGCSGLVLALFFFVFAGGILAGIVVLTLDRRAVAKIMAKLKEEGAGEGNAADVKAIKARIGA